ncbi:hypothetical protein CCASP_02680 [Corynebacterium caspium DSM 44850]|nr:hypothetical protein CCASP_02680 [Corynebacterium caspium DSM 44850]
MQVAALTTLAVAGAAVVVPPSSGLIPEANAGITCTYPAAPLSGTKAVGKISSRNNWVQDVTASTDVSEIYPGATFNYRVQVGSTYNWTKINQLSLILPAGMSVESVSNPYSSYCGFASEVKNAAYPEYQGDDSLAWTIASNTPGTGSGEFRQVDFRIKVSEDIKPGSAQLGLAMQVGPLVGASVTAENASFGPILRVNERATGISLSGDSVIPAAGTAAITARVSPLEATGRVIFSIAGRSEETVVDVQNGQAIWTVPSPDARDFKVNARFVSTNGFGTATAEPHSVSVSDTQTNLTLEHAARTDPGKPVTLTAQVMPRNANGQVKFTWTTNNGTVPHEKSQPVDQAGKATLEITPDTPGVETLSAQFIPAQGSAMAASPVKYSEITVGEATVALKKQSDISLNSPESATLGQSITLQATISPAGATGTVEFYNADQKIGSAAVSNTTAQLDWTPRTTGATPLHVKFIPDSAYLPSESIAKYVTVANQQAVIKSLQVESPATLLELVRVTAVMEQPDAEGVIRFYMGRNPEGNPQPSADNNDKTIIDVPITDTIATTTEVHFNQTGDSVPVHAIFIPKQGSKYSRSQAKTAFAKVSSPVQKAPLAGAISFDSISLSLQAADRSYRAGDLVQVHVHLENNESFINGLTIVNEIGLYAPKGFEFVSVKGKDISGAVSKSDSLIDRRDARYKGFKLANSSVVSKAFPGFGNRDFTVTYRVTDAAVAGSTNQFQVAASLYGGGDSTTDGGIDSKGKAIAMITKLVGPFLGETWGKVITAGGGLIGGFFKGRKRTRFEPRTAAGLSLTVVGTSGTGPSNPNIKPVNGSSSSSENGGSSALPIWVKALIGIFGSLGLFALGSGLYNVLRTQLRLP